MTERLGERTAFANKADTNGGCSPLLPAFVGCFEALTGGESARR